MRLEGKNVVVVGVGSGLGPATVYFLLREGANVMMVSRTRDRLEELKRQFSKYGKVDYTVGDPSTAKGAEAAMKAVAKKVKGIDGLALLAGTYVDTPLPQMKESDLDLMINSNIRAPLNALKAALPNMSKQSSVVMVASVLGLYGAAAGTVAYSATKAAVAKSTEVLAAELVGKGIRVNAVAPKSMNHDFEPERDWKKMRKLGDQACPPEDVARVVTWLITDESEWVDGVVIPVHGGARK